MCLRKAHILKGGEEALQAVVRRFAKDVLAEAPKVRDLIEGALNSKTSTETDSRATVESLECLRVAGPVMEPELNPELQSWLTRAFGYLNADDSSIRLAAARSVVAVVRSRPETLMNDFTRCALPLRADSAWQDKQKPMRLYVCTVCLA